MTISRTLWVVRPYFFFIALAECLAAGDATTAAACSEQLTGFYNVDLAVIAWRDERQHRVELLARDQARHAFRRVRGPSDLGTAL